MIFDEIKCDDLIDKTAKPEVLATAGDRKPTLFKDMKHKQQFIISSKQLRFLKHFVMLGTDCSQIECIGRVKSPNFGSFHQFRLKTFYPCFPYCRCFHRSKSALLKPMRETVYTGNPPNGSMSYKGLRYWPTFVCIEEGNNRYPHSCVCLWSNISRGYLAFVWIIWNQILESSNVESLLIKVCIFHWIHKGCAWVHAILCF